MKNKELFAFERAFQSPTLNEITDYKINYAIEKNKSLLKSEIEVIRKALLKVEGYDELSKNLEDLQRKAAVEKNENEILILTDKIKELENSNKTILDSVDKILEEESDFKLYKIKIPSDFKTISRINMSILFPIIEDETDKDKV